MLALLEIIFFLFIISVLLGKLMQSIGQYSINKHSDKKKEQGSMKMADAYIIEDDEFAEIKKAIPDFDHTHFLDGAKNAYKIINEHVGTGNIEKIKNLLSEDVYSIMLNTNINFDYYEVLAIMYAKIIKTHKDKSGLFIEVSFKSDQIFYKENEKIVVDGSKDKVCYKKEIWTFYKTFKDKNNIWILTSIKNI